MKALSTFTMKLDLCSKAASTRVHSHEVALGRGAARQAIGRFSKRTQQNGSSPVYRLGDSVRHGRYGTGRVMARMPDGRLQIRFDGVGKSQMIFPSLLQR
jgi:hypothetical protein